LRQAEGLENWPVRAHIFEMSFKTALFESALLGLYIAVTIASGVPLDAPLWAVCLVGSLAGPILVIIWFGWLDRRDRKAANR
jgi:hypothetical protein